MSLASYSFVLLFLPLTLFCYYRFFRAPRRKMFFLLASSMLFYSLAGWRFLPVLLGLSLFTFWAAQKRWFLVGIIINLGALALFKYWNFGVQNLNLLLKALHLAFAGNFLSLGLPLGISFFVFKHIGYLADVQTEQYPASVDPWTFVTFSAYFPQISAGPISSFKDTAGQFSHLPDRLEHGPATAGLIFLAYGLAKKVLIADQIGLLLGSSTNSIAGFSGLIPAWYLVIAYAARLYFDFTGYTDMALGVSTLFGIRLPPNFNSPYLAKSPGEFWERWHISLSMWFRHYLFLPMSRWLLKKWGLPRARLIQYAANLVTMSLIGLWHGAGWGYMLWGAYHGFLLNMNAWWKRAGREIPVWVVRPAFLLSLLLGSALFMSPDFPYLRHIFAGLIGYHGLGNPLLMKALWQNNATLSLLVAIPLAFSEHSEAAQILSAGRGQARSQLVAWGILAALSLLMLQNQVNFFYVQF